MKVVMNELVSIIIPAYQEEKWIERCLRSIINSTYKNLEIIVINDGSTDDTEKIVVNFKKKNETENISIKLMNISNGGSARARNLGICVAKGEYIGFADADDMIQPYMVERLVESLQRGNDLSICGLLYCNEDGKPGFLQYRICRQQKQCPGQALEMVMWEQLQMSVCSVLFRRERIMNEKGKPEIFFPEDVVAFEDFAFICKYINRCKGLIEALPFRGYLYCSHPDSSATKRHTAKEISYALKPILNIGEMMDDTDFIAHKLQYTFRFMAFWYERAIQDSRYDFSPDSEDWKVCIGELEQYADIYMKASNVAIYKKIAMWIVRKHPCMGMILSRTIGKLVICHKK